MLAWLLIPAGIFTTVLGILHFSFPWLLDFKNAIPLDGSSLKMFRLWPIRYSTKRRDVYGIAFVMNHAASYVLVTIGLLELSWTLWLATPIGKPISLWIAGWWFIRAGSQFYLGRRIGDWLILLGFAALGILHVLVCL